MKQNNSLLRSLYSIFMDEGIFQFLKRKRDDLYLNGNLPYTIHLNNQKVKIYLNKNNGYLDLQIFKNGIFEKEIINEILKHADTSFIFLDIGANIGQHSLLMAKNFKKVIAFEPVPDLFRQFQRSVKANKFDNVIINNTAIGSRKDTKEFFFITEHAGLSSFKNNANKKSKKIEVKVDLLNDYIPQNGRIGVMKIDVEGYEAVVILANLDVIKRNKPVIFLEFSPKGISNEGSHNPDELLEAIYDLNYKLYSINHKKYLNISDPELKESGDLILYPND